MNEYEKVLYILNLARKNASEDLNISNEILDHVQRLIKLANEENMEKEDVLCISKLLVDEALKLTDQSKKTSYEISKLTGAVK